MATQQSPLATDIELDMKKCDDFIVKYLEVGYKNSKAFNIKDGAQIAKYCRLISGDEKDESIPRENLYATVFQILEGMNKTGAFSLGDATLLQKIFDGVGEHYVTKKEKKEEDEPKIKEV